MVVGVAVGVGEEGAVISTCTTPRTSTSPTHSTTSTSKSSTSSFLRSDTKATCVWISYWSIVGLTWQLEMRWFVELMVWRMQISEWRLWYWYMLFITKETYWSEKFVTLFNQHHKECIISLHLYLTRWEVSNEVSKLTCKFEVFKGWLL